jgi:multicomponent Na+:H+ antiporter subunit G
MNFIILLQCFLFLSGSFIILSSAVGILKFPDVFCRSHAVGKGFTLGIMLLLLGLWLCLNDEKAGIKILIILVFQFMTIPVASHILGLLAYQFKKHNKEN